MNATAFPTIDLVPGDDWAGHIDIVDAQGQPLDLTGWIVTVFEVRWSMGAVPLVGDLAQAGNGRVGFSATETQTAPLPLGSVASIALKMRSPAGIDETLYVAPVRGVRIATDVSVAVVRAGTQGLPGRAFHAVDGVDDLAPGFGHDGDTAIIRSTGAEHRKSDGVWAPTGGSFWGTLLDDAGVARDEAEAARQATLAALADVTGLNETIAALSGGVRNVLSAADVVDIFVYDTRKDSDGGAWRDRCAGSSWYREALDTPHRGGSRRFPQIALLVAQPASVTIHDLDDPTCPMWMVFEAGPGRPLDTASTVNAVRALNGLMVMATGPTTGLVHADFVADRVAGQRTGTTGHALAQIAGRNGAAADIAGHWSAGLASANVASVAMSIAPGTQVDAARGMPAPTIDAFTGAGTSRMHASGTVSDLAAIPGDTHAGGDALADGGLVAVNTTQALIELHAAHKSWADGSAPELMLDGSSVPALLQDATAQDVARRLANDVVIGQPGGLNLIMRAAISAHSSICHITDTYLTGYQVGDIRLALAESSADLSDLVGALAVDDFDAAVPSQWQTKNATTASVSGELEVTADVPYGSAYREYAVVAGKPVRISGLVRRGTATGYAVRIRDGAFADPIIKHVVGAQTVPTAFSHVFVPSSPTVTVQVQVEDAAAGTTVSADDILVEGGGIDRSAADNAPIIVGTIGRQAVAEGADIASLGGFSDTDYLDWSPSHGFDFAADDFAVCGWLKIDGTGTLQTVLDRDSTPSAARYALEITATGRPRFVLDDGNGPVALEAPLPLTTGVWHFLVAGIRASKAELWVDGAHVAGAPAPGSLANASAALRIGEAVSGGSPLSDGQIALWRIGATMPDIDAIGRIHAAELPLMRDGARALLPAGAVNAVAHDECRRVLHVATDAGMARYAGLERIAADTAGVSAVHAEDDVIAKRQGDDVWVARPQLGLRASLLQSGDGSSRDGASGAGIMRAVTTDDMPVVAARAPVGSGGGIFRIITRARHTDVPAEQAAYEDIAHVLRLPLGDVVLAAPAVQRTLSEALAGMNVQIGIDPYHQAIAVTVTGLAATSIEWTISIEPA